ncbi:hypothetical protein [Sorangium sp. So ce1335]|uniref:hypothetical protein n=1 Tax=Sorangium sp. So ce1335 TaxID=3133335 RepID=UPI003F5DA336
MPVVELLVTPPPSPVLALEELLVAPPPVPLVTDVLLLVVAPTPVVELELAVLPAPPAPPAPPSPPPSPPAHPKRVATPSAIQVVPHSQREERFLSMLHIRKLSSL